jgi:hypothetical protein
MVSSWTIQGNRELPGMADFIGQARAACLRCNGTSEDQRFTVREVKQQAY